MISIVKVSVLLKLMLSVRKHNVVGPLALPLRSFARTLQQLSDTNLTQFNAFNVRYLNPGKERIKFLMNIVPLQT